MIDKLFFNFTRLSALLILIIVAWIFTVLFNHSMQAMSTFGFGFLTSQEWAPNLDKFGALPALVGSVASTLLAMLLTIPVALGVAIFLSEIAHDKIKGFFGLSVELLAAIPSIIYGMWGLFYFVPVIRDLTGGMGIGLLAAGIVLAIMILPFMAAVTRDAMNTTPDILKESAYALGGTQWDVIKDIIIPYAKAGIIGSVILALGRAIGETMAVTFVIGNAHHLPTSLLDQTTSIPVTLANEFAEAAHGSLHSSSLYALALILFILSFLTISIAKFYFLRKARRA